ncbi:MAG TPA: hypothetical protein VHE78_17435 [Gemmatimonadaceae bacterium]|nr:hypothetical protein [Gemmatimonadaceae bacterium]
MSASGAHTCGVTRSGAAYCWGSNEDGQLGDGTHAARSKPVAVSGGLMFAAVTAGVAHTCGLTTGGAAYCWGDNSDGQLGNGTRAASSTPVAVTGKMIFATVSAGFYFTCGLTSAGAAYCWGRNDRGQLGIGTTGAWRSTPVAVAGGLSFVSVSAPGSGTHACGLTARGAVWCWGDNIAGQLGNGTRTSSATPVPVAGGLAFVAVGTGVVHSCARTTSGAVYCWGNNDRGQLGDGTRTASLTPVPVRTVTSR